MSPLSCRVPGLGGNWSWEELNFFPTQGKGDYRHSYLVMGVQKSQNETRDDFASFFFFLLVFIFWWTYVIWAILDLFLALILGISLSRAGVYVVLEVELG